MNIPTLGVNRMNIPTLKPKSMIRSYSTMYDDNPVMQVIGENSIFTKMVNDDRKREEWDAITAALNHELERKGRLSRFDAMMVAYCLGVIHGKQEERRRKKKG